MSYSHVVAFCCALASLVPAAFVLLLLRNDRNYRSHKKPWTLASYVITHAITQLARIPTIVNEGGFATVDCGVAAPLYLFALYQLPMAYSATQADVLLEMLRPVWYSTKFRLANIAMMLVFVHFISIALFCLALPGFMIAVESASLHQPSWGSMWKCAVVWASADRYIIASWIYLLMYILCGLLGFAQIMVASIGYCMCVCNSAISLGANIAALNSGDHKIGTSELYSSRRQMCLMYSLGIVQFVILCLVALMPYIGFEQSLRPLFESIGHLLALLLPVLLLAGNPHTIKAAAIVLATTRTKGKHHHQQLPAPSSTDIEGEPSR